MLTAVSAAELHVQIQLDRTTVPVTMVTQEMAKQVVYHKASIAILVASELVCSIHAALSRPVCFLSRTILSIVSKKHDWK